MKSPFARRVAVSCLAAGALFVAARAGAAPPTSPPPADGDALDQTTPPTVGVVPPPAAPGEPLAERFCSAVHAFVETRHAACCQQSAGSSLAGECTRQLSAAITSHRVRLSAEAVDRCAAELATSLAGCDWVNAFLPALPASCRNVLQGNAARGASCKSAFDCGAGLACAPSGLPGMGICIAPKPAGATCGSSVDALGSVTRQDDMLEHGECAGYCRAGRCAAFTAIDASCRGNRECGPGHVCASGHCVAGDLPTAGQACAAGSCAGDASCVGGLCLALKASGEECAQPFECRGACIKAAGAETGKCGMQCNAWPPAGYTMPTYWHDSKTAPSSVP